MSDARHDVLVLEDEMIVAMDLQLQLEDAGCSVIGPVGTIEDASALLASHRPDWALLDVNVGKDTSFDLARRLHEGGTRVVFLTGKARATLPEEMQDMTVLQKPLRRNDLARLFNSGSTAAD